MTEQAAASIVVAEPAEAREARTDAAIQQREREQQLLRLVGFSLPDWDRGGRETCTLLIRERVERVDRTFFELGQLLLHARAHCPHGEWASYIEGLNIDPSMATAAMRWIERAASSPALRSLGPSKARLLTGMCAEDFRQLAEDGAVGGIKRDEIDGLTVRELRDKVRALKKINEKKAKLLEDRDETIDQLNAVLNDRLTEKQVAAAAPFHAAFARLLKAVAQFEASLDTSPDAEAATRAWSQVCSAAGTIGERRRDLIQPGLLLMDAGEGDRHEADRSSVQRSSRHASSGAAA